MELLDRMTALDAADVCVSYAGLVDRETACARDVTLWGEPAVEFDAATLHPPAVRGSHAA